MKLQIRFAYWLESAMFRQPEKEVRENRIIDYDVIRLQRIERLREYAREYASKSADFTKLYQADRLLTQMASKIDSKFKPSWQQ